MKRGVVLSIVLDVVFLNVSYGQNSLLDFYTEFTIISTGKRILDWVYTYTYDNRGRQTSQTIYVNPIDDSINLKKVGYSEIRYDTLRKISSHTLYTIEGVPLPTSYEISTYDHRQRLVQTHKFDVTPQGDTVKMSTIRMDPVTQRQMSADGINYTRNIPRTHAIYQISKNTLVRYTNKLSREGWEISKSVEIKRGPLDLQINSKKLGSMEWEEVSRYKSITRKHKKRTWTTLHNKNIRNKKCYVYNRKGDEVLQTFYLWNNTVQRWELKDTIISTYTYDKEGMILSAATDFGDRIRLREYTYKLK